MSQQTAISISCIILYESEKPRQFYQALFFHSADEPADKWNIYEAQLNSILFPVCSQKKRWRSKTNNPLYILEAISKVKSLHTFKEKTQLWIHNLCNQ